MCVLSIIIKQKQQDRWQGSEGQRGGRCGRVRKPAAWQGGARGGGGVERARVTLASRGTSWVRRGRRAIAGALRHMMCTRAPVPCTPPHLANTRARTCQRPHLARPLVATNTRMVIAVKVCLAPTPVARLPRAAAPAGAGPRAPCRAYEPRLTPGGGGPSAAAPRPARHSGPHLGPGRQPGAAIQAYSPAHGPPSVPDPAAPPPAPMFPCTILQPRPHVRVAASPLLLLPASCPQQPAVR